MVGLPVAIPREPLRQGSCEVPRADYANATTVRRTRGWVLVRLSLFDAILNLWGKQQKQNNNNNTVTTTITPSNKNNNNNDNNNSNNINK